MKTNKTPYSVVFSALKAARLLRRHKIKPSAKNNPADPAVIGTKYESVHL
jgi:hypothetical protein